MKWREMRGEGERGKSSGCVPGNCDLFQRAAERRRVVRGGVHARAGGYVGGGREGTGSGQMGVVEEGVEGAWSQLRTWWDGWISFENVQRSKWESDAIIF